MSGQASTAACASVVAVALRDLARELGEDRGDDAELVAGAAELLDALVEELVELQAQNAEIAARVARAQRQVDALQAIVDRAPPAADDDVPGALTTAAYTWLLADAPFAARCTVTPLDLVRLVARQRNALATVRGAG